MVCVKLAKLFGIKSLTESETLLKKKYFFKELNSTEIKDQLSDTEVPKVVNKQEDFLVKHVQNIDEILGENQNERNEDKLREEKGLKFKLAATVIDRLFFFMSLSYFVVSFSCLILSIQNFYKFN